MTGRLCVLVVDDHPVVRRGMRDLLEASGRYSVVAQASSAVEAEAQCRAHLPDVAVLDLRLPDMSGDRLTSRLLIVHPGLRVLVVTLHADPASARLCLDAGALGMLAKDTEADDLVRAVDAVAAGQQILGPGLGRHTRAGPPSPFDTLTPRELEVLDGMSRGLTNPEIAAELFLAPKTVRNLVSHVLMRLGVDDRVSAALLYDQRRRGRDVSRDT